MLVIRLVKEHIRVLLMEARPSLSVINHKNYTEIILDTVSRIFQLTVRHIQVYGPPSKAAVEMTPRIDIQVVFLKSKVMLLEMLSYLGRLRVELQVSFDRLTQNKSKNSVRSLPLSCRDLIVFCTRLLKEQSNTFSHTSNREAYSINSNTMK